MQHAQEHAHKQRANAGYVFSLLTNENNGKKTGTWTPTTDEPSARQEHAMSFLGNGKVLMYGGGSDYTDHTGPGNILNDAAS